MGELKRSIYILKKGYQSQKISVSIGTRVKLGRSYRI